MPSEGNVPGALELALAHALWSQRGHPFSSEYMALARGRYGAGLHQVDFLCAPEAARRAVNAWIEAETAGKIKDLVGPGMLGADTRLALTSAIHFKGAWAQPFDEGATADAPFHLGPGTEVAVPMMRQTAPLGYLETDAFQAVTLPYRGGDCSMAIFVPRAVDGLATLERQFTAPNLGRWTETMDRGREVRLWLPRFSVSSRFRLSAVLASMGLAGAFDPAADFTDIVEAAAGPLWLGEVIHGARIDLDEEGTEAAAATAGTEVFGMGEEPVRREPVVVKADRPFLYVIRHRFVGAILFMGRLADPRGLSAPLGDLRPEPRVLNEEDRA